MSRAQCIVARGRRVLMVMNRQDSHEWWCLPGGAIEPGETPEDAVLRELKEECGVTGKLVRQTSVYSQPSPEYTAYTYHVDVGNQEPSIGGDPELGKDQILKDVRWMSLRDVPERDRVFLWAAGLVTVEEFLEEVAAWGNDTSYPSPSCTVADVTIGQP